jgi:ribosomal-protein-alanine N-acetyltransferase
MPGPGNSAGTRPVTKLRPYAAEDFESVYNIDQACYPPGIAYTRRMLRWYLHQPGADCIVAEVDGEPAGFILTDRYASQGHVITIDVLEAHRRCGIGSALLRDAEHHLRDDGIDEVTLETATNNEPAVAFWNRHGYRTRGVLPRYYQGRLDAFHMSKEL